MHPCTARSRRAVRFRLDVAGRPTLPASRGGIHGPESPGNCRRPVTALPLSPSVKTEPRLCAYAAAWPSRFRLSGRSVFARKAEWPRWTPDQNMKSVAKPERYGPPFFAPPPVAQEGRARQSAWVPARLLSDQGTVAINALNRITPRMNLVDPDPIRLVGLHPPVQIRTSSVCMAV